MWTRAGGDSIHIYSDPPSIDAVAIANGDETRNFSGIEITRYWPAIRLAPSPVDRRRFFQKLGSEPRDRQNRGNPDEFEND